MHSMRMTTAIITLFAAALLAGCQSTDLAACKEKNAKLANDLAKAEMKLAENTEDMDKAGVVIGNVFIDLEAKTKRISELEKANADLKKEIEILRLRPDESKRITQGVEELRRLQKEAAEKLKKQQAADANKP
jgi:hypothetical protein